jgi:hypothetical protein
MGRLSTATAFSGQLAGNERIYAWCPDLTPKDRYLSPTQLGELAQTLKNKTLETLKVDTGVTITKLLQAALNFDPASINAGVTATQAVTVSGAAVGDHVIISVPDLNTDGIAFAGRVTAANTVTLRLTNYSGGAINLAALTVSVIVMGFA